MELFRGDIIFDDKDNDYTNRTLFPCGSYEQLGYWANNFDDFAVSIFYVQHLEIKQENGYTVTEWFYNVI